MIFDKQRAFLEARTQLPSPVRTSAKIIVVAAGSHPALWTHHYVYIPGPTQYFIFIREPLQNRWKCTDEWLQQRLDVSNVLALRLLERVVS